MGNEKNEFKVETEFKKLFEEVRSINQTVTENKNGDSSNSSAAG